MPSLRRTFSSPSVRSSPYPTALSISSAHGSARVNGHRRSSGSESSGRRVLADLEWWRVVDGQHSGEADQESEDRDHQDSMVAPTGDYFSLVEVIGVDRPSTPINWSFQSPTDTVESFTGLPVSQFAALSIAPSTPPRHHTRGIESTSSSLESTPEAPEQPRERIRDLGFADAGLPPMLPSFGMHHTPPPFLMNMNRSILYDCGTVGRFADIGVDIFG